VSAEKEYLRRITRKKEKGGKKKRPKRAKTTLLIATIYQGKKWEIVKYRGIRKNSEKGAGMGKIALRDGMERREFCYRQIAEWVRKKKAICEGEPNGERLSGT